MNDIKNDIKTDAIKIEQLIPSLLFLGNEAERESSKEAAIIIYTAVDELTKLLLAKNTSFYESSSISDNKTT